MKKYYKVWLLLTQSAVQTSLASRFGVVILVLGKIIRFFFFFFFLYLIGSKTKIISGYSLSQIIFFFLTYQIIDLLPQFFMREVYRFREYVVKGDFDYFLVKPISALFRSLFGGTDPLDTPLIVLTLIFLVPQVLQLAHGDILRMLAYLIFIGNALLIAVSFHILVLALGIVTTEIDNAIMFYRDITQMGRIPVDIYKEPLKGLITFAIPVGVMMTIPAKALMGILSLPIALVSLCIGGSAICLSLFLWRQALKQYGSASS